MEDLRESFILAAAREFVAERVAPEQLDAAMEGVKIARYEDGFTDALLRGVAAFEAHVNDLNRDKQPSIEYLMSRVADADGMDMFRRTNAWLDEYSKGTVLAQGVFSDTGQSALTVCLFRKRPLMEQLQILDFVPLIKPVGGHKIIGVREPTLSQHGIHEIRISEDGRCTFGRYSGRFARMEKQFDDLMQCLSYVHQHHGNRDYEDPSDNDYED